MEVLVNILCVGAGGAVGSLMRYGMEFLPVHSTFPVATLITNVAGSFLIGLFAGMVANKVLPKEGSLFLKTGLCGGFTTFSTFALESEKLFTGGNGMVAIAYIVSSVVLGVFAAMAGLALANVICPAKA
jgi:CrcB protein